ncbi:PREDICTED: myb-like protein X [Tarenaya hassleriana]|uniref:myb-like protein X n=1 Tax=Tarenaya hassleriana TaxID=28532 RepID=UPI00053C0B83|nr:PREDICTED: myb-like protein X [Tarenaya hassleriana]XP_010524661.1 PREDICTED: myb-like protein X [Tarenaya hassleriana]XP_019056730.1 PREDICTED: myb-like protein X [Tarenaya hassleriana]
MSRCFPFPPPGYEKKIKTDEADLTKEKHKEKKQKKDKKDKEKKDGREKKDRERSKDKHKERKEKKEKHKDGKDKDRDKEKSRTWEEKKTEVLTDTRETEKLVTNTLQNNSNGDSRFVQDLARRIRDGEAAMGSQGGQKTKIPDQINAGLTGNVVENKLNNSPYSVQETNHRIDNDKRIHPQRNLAVAKSAENVVPRVSFGSDQKKAEGMVKPVERKKDQEKQMESVEKNQHKGSVIKSDKPRDKEGLKKAEPKGRDTDKERKQEKAEVTNRIGQEKPKSIEGPRLKERDKDAVDNRNSKPPDLFRASNKNLTGEGNLGKRKDLERNGFLYENGSNRPNKLQRPVASPVSLAVENGRKLGTPRTGLQSEETKTHPKPGPELKSVETKTPQKSASALQGTSCKSNVKEHRVNGFSGTQKPKIVPPNSLAEERGEVKVKGRNGEASVKLPHPDLKYLNQVLKVPEREELTQFDDQEWLYGDSTVKLKKPRTDETRQVWDQAFRIESADTVALPYVVPF